MSKSDTRVYAQFSEILCQLAISGCRCVVSTVAVAVTRARARIRSRSCRARSPASPVSGRAAAALTRLVSSVPAPHSRWPASLHSVCLPAHSRLPLCSPVPVLHVLRPTHVARCFSALAHTCWPPSSGADDAGSKSEVSVGHGISGSGERKGGEGPGFA